MGLRVELPIPKFIFAGRRTPNDKLLREFPIARFMSKFE